MSRLTEEGEIKPEYGLAGAGSGKLSVRDKAAITVPDLDRWPIVGPVQREPRRGGPSGTTTLLAVCALALIFLVFIGGMLVAGQRGGNQAAPAPTTAPVSTSAPTQASAPATAVPAAVPTAPPTAAPAVDYAGFFTEFDRLLAQYEADRLRLSEVYTTFRAGRTPAGTFSGELAFQRTDRQAIRTRANALRSHPAAAAAPALVQLVAEFDGVMDLALQTVVAEQQALDRGVSPSNDAGWLAVETLSDRTRERYQTFTQRYGAERSRPR